MIVFVHLLNDYSGSPRVLKETIKAVVGRQEKAKLYIGSSGNGLLSDCGIPITRFWYHRPGYRFVTLFTYFSSQFMLFFKLLFDRTIDRDAVLYINTLLPFGAALYGKLTGRKIIYHLHEISITPAPLKSLLTAIVRRTSALNIYVSDAHMDALKITGVPAQRVHNTLDVDIVARASTSVYQHHNNGCFNVLMIASLRDYKGVPELLAIATALLFHDNIRFQLLVNDDEAIVANYFQDRRQPGNLTVYPRTADVMPFYEKASLVLNLSRIDQWVETFGMTILEAMAFGLPVIAPPVGGPTEIVRDGLDGYLISSYEVERIARTILNLSKDKEKCQSLSQHARQRTKDFNKKQFETNILKAIYG